MILADEACQELELDQVLWVLTPNPPHKRNSIISPLADRAAMLKAALADDPRFKLSRVEMDRLPPHYAVDTMHLLKQQFPTDELIYLMGSDSVHDLPSWYNPLGFIRACDGIGMMVRPGSDVDLAALNERLPGLCDKICVFNAPLLDIASSEIRQLVKESGPFRYYLLPGVYQVIQERQLYR